MASKEVKTALKSARESIKNKEFKEALKHCKSVLKLEKNNYNAWVFIGLSASELDQPDQAQAAYKKAAELEPDQLLAWQGLANLYEKSDQADFKADLPPVYQKLITLYESSDKAKCQEVSKKLMDIYHSEKNHLQVARVCHRLIQVKEREDGIGQAELLQLWLEKIRLLKESVEEQDNETQQHLTAAFEKALDLTASSPSEDHLKLLKDYITCLSKLPHEVVKMKDVCETMLSLYPTNPFPLEILATYYLQSGVCCEDALSCFRRLADLEPDSGLAVLGQGVQALQAGKYEDALKSLAQGLKKLRSSVIGWYSLAKAQLGLHRYGDSATSCSQGLKAVGDAAHDWRQKLLKLRLEALVRSGVQQNADAALQMLPQIADADNDPVLLSLKGRAHLLQGHMERASEVCTELLESHPGSADGFALNGLVLRAKEELQAAEESLLKAVGLSPETGEFYFLLGQLYWEMGEETRRDRSKAHTHLLKAAKLDPNAGAIFRYLGRYYREAARDAGRARGCYKRAFELDGSDGEAGAATVDLSMEQGDMDSALTVLQAVTAKATPGSAKWAWMRRGLYHLKTNQHPQAIADLQAALRADPEAWVCWECLGEAYLMRRSFTAALKAFAKAHELQPDSIYSLYQMANIKQTLCRFKEAAVEYTLITQREDYVPALKGLGECYLAMARGALEDYLDGRAIDLIQKAIECLYRAVQRRPDLSCLWKLLGDGCTTCSGVSPNRAELPVPSALLGTENSEPSQMLDQSELLKLGERCYGQALKLMPETPGLWCDLGLNYKHQAKLQQDQQQAQPLLQKALQCVKKAVMLDSGNHTYWNALGVVSMATGIENDALAQHCFIKSVKAEANNVVAWSNLGVLYLRKGNVELSHEAFKIAQSLEPLYVNCWIGQSLIAETVGSYDTMDLFRHTTELSTHTEGVRGYAYCVCSTLLDKSNRDSELYRYNIVQMNAVSAAQVALSKYTERVQTDSEAFIMLGYLNEHLQLQRQATIAYQRAVELLQSTPHADELNFALSNYGRALCNMGQWEEAVRVYSSTPLEELQDLTGLALACFQAGQLQDSINAYEKALAMASTEKEKAYILTALALLQHRLGCVDTAKTLLFKCSLLKEPVCESLLCLCSLGLVHGDATLATAALSELLKHSAATGGAVEERCLLTCALLATQGNYSGVQREAARAVHRNPGNPTLWALLSRLVPQCCPRKADGGAVAGRVACQANMTQGKRALLYSAVNQLAVGRHSGEDSRTNALKSMQRAILLCPDDPAGWAGLMAACHTENTACSLSGSAPQRQGLEKVLMSLVLEKVKGLPRKEQALAQALESWALQQTVTALRHSGQYDEAETLCSQLLTGSPENPALILLLRQVQCERLLLAGNGTGLPGPVLEQLSAAVMANPTSVAGWHWLAEVYQSQGFLSQASVAYKQSLQVALQLGAYGGQLGSLLRLALLALEPCRVNGANGEWRDLLQEATVEVLKVSSSSPVALLLQALLQFYTKMGARDTRRLLERIVYAPNARQHETVTSVARWYLLRHLHAKDDQELMDTLLAEAKAAGDTRLMDFHKRLCPSP